MIFLVLSLIILGGLVAGWYLTGAITKELRSLEKDEDKELRKNIEIWRSGK